MIREPGKSAALLASKLIPLSSNENAKIFVEGFIKAMHEKLKKKSVSKPYHINLFKLSCTNKPIPAIPPECKYFYSEHNFDKFIFVSIQFSMYFIYVGCILTFTIFINFDLLNFNIF
uniref:Uncharacterized protein n=1 Tax=Clytia hemisphaerica TaxID=252671 RepID=A0A7M6DRY9_9CNID